MDAICSFRELLIEQLLYPLFLLVFAVGLLVFIYGIVEFLYGINFQGSATARDDGKRHMVWGLAGMFIMFVAYSIVQLVIYIVGGDIVQCPAV